MKTAIRNIVRRPRVIIVVVILLAIGIGANGAMLGLLRSLYFSVPPGIVDSRSVVRVLVTRNQAPFAPETAPLGNYSGFRALSEGVSSLTAMSVFATTQLTAGTGEDARQLTVQLVSPSYFGLLGVQPLVGSFFSESDDRAGTPIAVISHRFWTEGLGADGHAVGRELLIGTARYTIGAIAQRGFRGADWSDVDVWLPVRTAAPEFGRSLDCLDCHWLQTIGRLQSGVSKAQAADEATAVLRNSRLGETSSLSIALVSLQTQPGQKAADSRKVGIRLGGIAVLVYLMVCTIVANLGLAVTIERRHEMALRRALGASWWHIAKQLLIEESVVGAAGFACAVPVGVWTGSIVAAQLLQGFNVGSLSVGSAALFALPATLIAMIGARIVPILVTSRVQMRAVDRRLTAGSHRVTAAQAVLVGSQVAITLAMLVVAGLFLKSLRAVTSIRLGIDPYRLVYVSIDSRQRGLSRNDVNQLYDRMLESVRRLPSVEDASLSIGSPFVTSMAMAFVVPGAVDSMYRSANGGPYVQFVSTNYFSTMGTMVRRGRLFESTDVKGSGRVVLVSERMARSFWPYETPLGHCIKIGPDDDVPCSEVVGVVEDVKRLQVIEQPTMQYYVPLQQLDSAFVRPVNALFVRTRRGAESAIQDIRTAVQRSSPSMPFATVSTMTDLYGWQLRSWKLGSIVLSGFSALGLLLASVGLYGVMSYYVSRRAREIGIRFALGANPVSVKALVLRRGLTLAGVGMLMGSVVSLLLGRLVRELLYEIDVTDATTYAQAALVLTLAAFCACYWPAKRAASIDPATALREDA